MMTTEQMKHKVVHACDILEGHYRGTIYQNELTNLRKKYIYKDISRKELIHDKQYLRNLWSMTKIKIK